jgi:hypothetical protein
MLITSAQQVGYFSNIFGHLQHVAHLDIEALVNNFGWDPGFWLCDGGTIRECHLRVQASCEVQRHNRGIGNGMRVIQYHLELSNVTILARGEFNDLRAPGSSECSIRQYFLNEE